MRAPKRFCRRCGSSLFRMTTDGRGNLLEVEPLCTCEKRRRAGVCQNCPRPVDGQRGKALRCVRHKKEAERRWVEVYRARNREQVLETAREYQRRSRASWTPEKRAEVRAEKRQWKKDMKPWRKPEEARKNAERARRWREQQKERMAA